jgi:hypothetical protein
MASQPLVMFRREVDRRSVLRGAALAGLAGALGLVGAQRLRTQAVAQTQNTTVDLLNLAITIEALLAHCYGKIFDYDLIEGREREILQPIEQHHQRYIEMFRQVVTSRGGTPVEIPAFHVPQENYASREAGLRMVWQTEETALRGWQGMLSTVNDPEIVPLLRPVKLAMPAHATVLAILLGGDAQPFPGAIEPGAGLQETLAAIEEFRGAE